MTVDGARSWIIITSLVVTGLTFGFLVAAPPLGYPLGWDQSQRIIEILLPVFLGYVGTATHFVFHTRNQDQELQLGSRAPLLGLIIRGPIVVFVSACVVILFAFGYSNRANAIQGEGMSVDQLAWAFTAALGILSVSTGVAVSYLFSLSDHAA